MQASEIGDILEHRLDNCISQFIRLRACGDQHGTGANGRDLVGVALVHTAGNDSGGVIRMFRQKPVYL